MALGALIGAYQEDDSGGLRALLPLAGRTMVEYQARCAAAAGAAPIIVIVERMPLALEQAFARLRDEGINVVPVNDGTEAATRFEPGELILLMMDGLAPDAGLVRRFSSMDEPGFATVPDDAEHDQFERIDASSRWAGLALLDSRTLSATAAMLGDWDLHSTLLRRLVQSDARRMAVEKGASPLLATEAGATANFERRLLIASRGARTDWPSRYILPLVEDVMTERLMDTPVRPQWLIFAALAVTLAAALSFAQGWGWAALALLLIALPLDLVADRLASLRLRPLPANMLARRALWPAMGVALLALGWWQSRASGDWAALVAAVACAAFAEAARIEHGPDRLRGEQWLFSVRGAVLAIVPFALMGWWSEAVLFLFGYAGATFFYVQRERHRTPRD